MTVFEFNKNISLYKVVGLKFIECIGTKARGKVWNIFGFLLSTIDKQKIEWQETKYLGFIQQGVRWFRTSPRNKESRDKLLK